MAASRVKAATRRPRRKGYVMVNPQVPPPRGALAGTLAGEIQALGEIVMQQGLVTRQVLDKNAAPLATIAYDLRTLCKFAEEAAAARTAAVTKVHDRLGELIAAVDLLRLQPAIDAAPGAAPWYGMPGTATPAWVAEVNQHIGEILRRAEAFATMTWVDQLVEQQGKAMAGLVAKCDERLARCEIIINKQVNEIAALTARLNELADVDRRGISLARRIERLESHFPEDRSKT